MPEELSEEPLEVPPEELLPPMLEPESLPLPYGLLEPELPSAKATGTTATLLANSSDIRVLRTMSISSRVKRK